VFEKPAGSSDLGSFQWAPEQKNWMSSLAASIDSAGVVSEPPDGNSDEFSRMLKKSVSEPFPLRI
jgi:hypothetical protein